jgi:hypothetical protein
MELNQIMTTFRKIDKYLIISIIGLTTAIIIFSTSCIIINPSSTPQTSKESTNISINSPTTSISSKTSPTSSPSDTIINQFLTKLNIKTGPGLGDYLVDSFDRYSGVILEDIEVDKYYAYKDVIISRAVVKKGDPILVIIGGILNKHQDYPWVLMWATGYDTYGKEIAWTYDSTGPGAIHLKVELDETSRFTLHMNYSENVESIHIYAQTLNIHPP